MPSELRNRKGASATLRSPEPVEKKKAKKPVFKSTVADSNTDNRYRLAKIIVTVFAFATRFYLINDPKEVVFDEVHFGKFASYYLEGTYFFDLHPPFAKMLIAFVGWLVGYDGAFKFENIGDSYIANRVPYVAYRSLSATLGALTVPIVFETLQECGFSVWACVIGSSLILFDNAHIAETRLILLDATLIISVALSLYAYVRFSKQRDSPFSRDWWTWLLATGVSLSFVISTKYVGAFTFTTVGAAVLIDLWNLLDYRRGLSMKEFGKHFFARLFSLIFVPLCIFLFWFWVHFAILTKSGPGDGFMSSKFQETLGDNILAKLAKQVNYYDEITISHKESPLFLSSGSIHYPLRYDDGRISSQGQLVSTQELVNGAPTNDQIWQIVPVVDFPEGHREGIPIETETQVRLKHVSTNSFLLAHDVASPYYPTNEEFTTASFEEAEGPRFNDTLFEIRSVTGEKDILKTKGSFFRLIHVPTRVAMWTHDDKQLPAEWASGHYEVNGVKNVHERTATWFVDEIVNLTDPERLKFTPRAPRKMNFFRKYLELQYTMFAQNNALTSSHPYASEPITWPFLVRGVSFWTKDTERRQIYFIGNFIGWWIEAAMLAIYAGVVVADQLTRRRAMYPINDVARSKIYNSLGFFFIAWATHYFPFFLMGRQKFLHHYLPAHLAAALLTGGLYDFVFCELDDEAVHAAQSGKKRSNWRLKIVSVISLVGIVICFAYFSPLTYGNTPLTPAEVRARQWMDIELHFAK
ncbi:Pmt4p [Sugiyamaella lignohabitans]|uniref:Dolichyl-phosphate-mannose--protein mannosyltransferase n=1 Tax=Sugiyamaella lignohabitans TaxID=796027 RepID=A0A167EAR1_9ASCO|nr:Pmt4p [Sugiyamaella lignohabitans]ANB13845.1 Pmt4p [Sugiyamaella lignohabitans]